MREENDAFEYEKTFLERYFRSQAQKKIEKIDAKIQECRNQSQIMKYVKEKEEILSELEKDLKEIGTEEKKENVEAKDTASEDYVFKGYTIPCSLWNKLFKYQQEGVTWLLDLHSKERGGILADEMGLGKTIQCIAFLSGVLSLEHKSVIFIVCPVTVISQWQKEIKSTLGDALVSAKVANSPGIRVVGYEIFRKKYRGEKIDILILDEGHRIKNREAQITQTLKKVRCNRNYILTGTPIQNNLSELWSLIDFVVPSLLGSYNTFQEEYEENIKDKKNTERSYRYSTMLRSAIEPYILRRTKAMIANSLPGRSDQVLFVPLTPYQENIYIRALESRFVINALENRGVLLGVIDYLRKICNHPFLLKHPSSGYETKRDCENMLIESSSKVQTLLDLLKQWEDSASKALVFTQTVQMQCILERVLKKEGISYLKMSGETNLNKRKLLVDAFQSSNEIRVFLLTTKVGGLGLNLTSANKIVLYDPDWNPSTDNQAKERIHRYGQKNDVETYRLISKNTIEEKIYQKQIYKNCLARKILNNPRTAFSDDAILDFFEYKRSASDATAMKPYEFSLPSKRVFEDIREEDRSNFEILKNLNTKRVLTGKELIDFIRRRELSL